MPFSSPSARLLPPRFYYVALLVVLALFAASLVGRYTHFDDAWSAEEAFWLLRDGYVHSELFRGFGGWENRLYIFHKGYIYLMAAELAVLGESLVAVKSVALLSAVATLGLLLRYFRAAPAEARWLAALLYVGCGSVMMFGFAGRPETTVALCGFASYLVLHRADGRLGRLAAAGALAGLAGLVHPNGTLYMAAGALWLIWYRAGWRALFSFSVPAAAVLALFALDAALVGELPVLADQFVNYPVVAPNLHLSDKLRVMARYHSIFFHSAGEIALSVVALVALALAWWSRRATVGLPPLPKPVLRYIVLLLGLFWLLTKSPTAYYYLLFVPFLVVLVVEITLSAGQWKPGTRRVLLALVVLYPVGTLAQLLYVRQLNQRSPDIMALNARLAAQMPVRGAKVIAPLDFIFGQIDNYRIRGLTFLTAPATPLDSVFARAAADSVQYIIPDYNTSNDVYHIPPTAPARIGEYQRVYQDQWRALYERQPAQP
ncbi:glycosyltransferase family 39 protein [Hymenobacter lapidiphilus]|uniref:glycosyltransferase family 39 protein n=1 Tax=Hymenobacter sp. CCM 8763 TaxID=2303334 RepID=UPI0011C1472C|nr:glycosyltransferase family 39 protein [Hymenobacter sp. CCM 8763]